MITDPFLAQLEEAESFIKKNQLNRARELYVWILERHPNHRKAQQGLESILQLAPGFAALSSPVQNQGLRTAPELPGLPWIGLLKKYPLGGYFLALLLGGLGITALFRDDLSRFYAQQQVGRFTIQARRPRLAAQNKLKESELKKLLVRLQSQPLYYFFAVRSLDATQANQVLLDEAQRRLNEVPPPSKRWDALDIEIKEISEYLAHDPNNIRYLRAFSGALAHAARTAAGESQWQKAEDYLWIGFLAFPEDKVWGARLQLVESIKKLPEASRASWLMFVG